VSSCFHEAIGFSHDQVGNACECCLPSVWVCVDGQEQSKEIAERAVEVFHSQLDSERYSEMYAQADEDFKKSSSQEDLEKLLRAVHQKLGKVQAANQIGYLVNVGSETFVTLTYDTTFVDGKATEQFVWRVRHDRAALYNYNINSADLVTR
jgi:hypothetical protein